MEIFGQFGVEPVLFIAQVVNFLIVFLVLKKFLLKPIKELLKNREDTIKTGLAQAEEARVLLEQASEKEKTMLRKAQTEAKEIISTAKKESEDLLQKAEMSTKQKVDKMLLEAREQITNDTKEAEKRLTKNISELAITYLERSVAELFTEADQEVIMNKAVKSLRKKAD